MLAKRFATTFASALIVSGLASAWAVASPMGAGCAAAASIEQIAPASSETSAFVARVNELRASKGLGALSVDGNLSSVAQDWALHMAQNDAIAHRSSLATGITINWQLLGENVGVAPDVNQAMDAFINSPSHYENLVNPNFNHIGVGTVRTPDGLYTAHEFAQISAAPAAASMLTPASTPAVTKAPVAPTATSTPQVDASVDDVEGSPISNNTDNGTEDNTEKHNKVETGC